MRHHPVVYIILLISLLALVSASQVGASTTVFNASSTTWTDNFSSSSLDSRWSWVREDPTHWSLTARPGYLRITTKTTFSTVNNLLVQNSPGGDYELETRVFFTPTQNYQFASLLAYQDDNNFLAFGRAYCDTAPPTCVGNGIYFDRIEGGVLVGSNHATTIPVPGEAYLKLERHGNVYSGSVSIDGTNWTLIGVHTVTIRPTKIGLRVSNQAQGDTEIPADFDFFTLVDNSQHLYLPSMLR